MQPGFRKEAARRPADSALRRYLLRSKEAALRQSSRKQNSGYWRQISRPTSSLSRCFSFSPIVRTQGAISAGVSDAVLPPEAEIEATAINFPRLRPAGPPARRPTHTAAHRRTVRWVRTPKAPPPGSRRACAAVGQGPVARRPRGRHPAQHPWRPAAPPSQPELRAGLPCWIQLHQRPTFFGNPGKAAALSNGLYCGGERERFVPEHKRNYSLAVAGTCLRDTPSSRGRLRTVAYVPRTRGGMERVLPSPATPQAYSSP